MGDGKNKKSTGISPVLLLLVVLILLMVSACGTESGSGESGGQGQQGAESDISDTAVSGTPTESPDKPLSGLPEEYTIEMAIQNGDYVNVHGEISNAGVMNEFISKAEQKQKAFVRTVMVTIEGDPVITDFYYDGDHFTVEMDTTRDKFSADRSIESRQFKNLVVFDDKASHTRYYIVTDEKEITEEISNRGFEGVTLKYEEYGQ